jgi:hypothetical protein
MVEPQERDRIAAAWVAMIHSPRPSPDYDRHFWAYMRLRDLVEDEPEVAWDVIQAVVKLDTHTDVLGNLGAGAVEDLLNYHGARFIDRIEQQVRVNQHFRKVLHAVWPSRIRPDIWARVEAARAF